MDNSVLNRRVEEITRDNTRLKDNEKEMFKVSTIITTSNENAKLKSYISILEKQLEKYRVDQKVVVYEGKNNSNNVEAEIFSTNNHNTDHEETTSEIVPKDGVDVEEISDNKDNVVNVEDEKKVSGVEEVVEEEALDIQEEENTKQDEINVFPETAVDDEEEVVSSVFKVFRYKEKVYLIDDDKNLYENIDGEAGENIGRRKLNTKTGKWKTILFDS